MSPVPLRFNGFLEGLTELRKPAILVVMVCYSEEIQVKISKARGKFPVVRS